VLGLGLGLVSDFAPPKLHSSHKLLLEKLDFNAKTTTSDLEIKTKTLKCRS